MDEDIQAIEEDSEPEEDGLIPCQYIQLIHKSDYAPSKLLCVRPRRNIKGKLDNILSDYNNVMAGF